MNLYFYKAKFITNYDGDTVTVDIDLGMQVWLKNQKLRLIGIDTPEIRGGTSESKKRAIKARDFIRNKITAGTEIRLKTHRDKSGKFGRLLAELFYGENFEINLNEELIKKGFAKKYE